jgi:hypothetical protein
VLLQIAVWKVLHRYEDVVAILVPAKGLDKALLILEGVSEMYGISRAFHGNQSSHTLLWENRAIASSSLL